MQNIVLLFFVVVLSIFYQVAYLWIGACVRFTIQLFLRNQASVCVFVCVQKIIIRSQNCHVFYVRARSCLSIRVFVCVCVCVCVFVCISDHATKYHWANKMSTICEKQALKKFLIHCPGVTNTVLRSALLFRAKCFPVNFPARWSRYASIEVGQLLCLHHHAEQDGWSLLSKYLWKFSDCCIAKLASLTPTSLRRTYATSIIYMHSSANKYTSHTCVTIVES
jgi:hypothetical protein